MNTYFPRMYLTDRFQFALSRFCVAAALILSSFACSAEEPDVANTVVIVGKAGEKVLPYRVMLAGLDAFSENHELAPNSDNVYFKLKAGKSGESLAQKNSLHIVGDTTSILVPISVDGSFTLPCDQKADDEDADLVLDKNNTDFVVHIDVFSAGVPSGMRRLGDLRLECEVGMAMAKKNINLLLRATVTTFLLTSHWCGSDKFKVPSYSERPLQSATLVKGDQRVGLVVLKDKHSFEAPINDRHFTDDQLIELQFEDEAASQ